MSSCADIIVLNLTQKGGRVIEADTGRAAEIYQEKQSQLKAPQKTLHARQSEQERKERTKRLIENGALSEKYLNCRGMTPCEFEQVLKQVAALDYVKRLLAALSVCRADATK